MSGTHSGFSGLLQRARETSPACPLKLTVCLVGSGWLYCTTILVSHIMVLLSPKLLRFFVAHGLDIY